MAQLNSLERYLAKASKTYHRQLAESESLDDHPTIGRYLTDHGIAEGRIVATYRLGVVGEPLPGDERFAGMLVIPYLTRGGVKTIRFRNMNGGKPKFAQHAGQKTRLYNAAAYFKADDTIGITEGEIDAIVATEILGIPTMGIPGAQMWSAHKSIWVPVFKNFSRVLVLRDGDDAGQELADAVSDSLKWRARTIEIPKGEDVSSMVAAGRQDEILSKIGDDSE